jgi:undecaprenyl diphosphate synthase
LSDLLTQIRARGGVPGHVAVIMDGNGRWARQKGLPRSAGHQAGMASVHRMVATAIEAGVETLTIFAFSQENWQRPPEEIEALMALLQQYVTTQSDELCREGVRVRMLGDLSPLSEVARKAVEFVETATVGGGRLALNICISYGGRAEITRAVRLIAEKVASGEWSPDQITQQTISERLYTAPWGDPDLLIRTSGEYRISNFLLWQLAYAEIYVTPVLWPDFGREDFLRAIEDYQRRDRRFGRVAKT